jgi:hypothetical protein
MGCRRTSWSRPVRHAARRDLGPCREHLRAEWLPYGRVTKLRHVS